MSKFRNIYNDKVIWISGASSGIGESLAYTLSQLGAKLIISSRNEKKLIEVKSACESPANHMVLPLDLEDNKDYSGQVKKVIERFGTIDYVFHVGGVGQFSSVLETTPEVERKIFETNYFGAVALTKEILPYMLQKNSGHFVVVSSLMGKFGPPMRSSYTASKHALHGYFDSLRAEVSGEGVGVTMICPGFIKTNISYNYLNANGDRWNYLDKDHQIAMSPENSSLKIIKAVALKKYETNVAGKEVVAVYVKRFFPNIFTRIMAKYSFKRDDKDE